MFFQKYGKAAVLFARFLPPVRAFVPITAGAMGMTPRQFYPINLVAILLWAPVQVIPGMLAGNAYRHAGAIAGHLTLPIIAGIAGIVFLFWGIRRWLRVGQRANHISGPDFPHNSICHAEGRLRRDHACRISCSGCGGHRRKSDFVRVGCLPRIKKKARQQ